MHRRPGPVLFPGPNGTINTMGTDGRPRPATFSDQFEPTPTRAERSRRRLVFGLVVVFLIVAASGVVVWRLSHPNAYEAAVAALGPTGDPGGRVLAQLSPIRNAIPKRYVHINYAQYQEPHADSCDGQPNTVGWDDAVVQINFKWTGTDTNLNLMYFAETKLAQDNWTVSQEDSPPYLKWSKTLRNKAAATASLEREDDGSWTLLGEAPPVGPGVTGC